MGILSSLTTPIFPLVFNIHNPTVCVHLSLIASKNFGSSHLQHWCSKVLEECLLAMCIQVNEGEAITRCGKQHLIWKQELILSLQILVVLVSKEVGVQRSRFVVWLLSPFWAGHRCWSLWRQEVSKDGSGCPLPFCSCNCAWKLVYLAFPIVWGPGHEVRLFQLLWCGSQQSLQMVGSQSQKQISCSEIKVTKMMVLRLGTKYIQDVSQDCGIDLNNHCNGYLLIGKEQNSCSQSKERIVLCCGQEWITCKDNKFLLREPNCIETAYKLEHIGQSCRVRIVSSCFACCGTGLSP